MTSAMNAFVAPTPMGMIVVDFWPNVRRSQLAACPATSGYITTLKSASPRRAMSAGRAPSGAITFTSTPRFASRLRISVRSSRWRNPSVVGPRMLQRGGPSARVRCVAGRGSVGPRERAHDPVQGLGRAPVLLALVGGELQRNDGNGQRQRSRQPARIVLDEFGRARRANQNGLGLETLVGVAHRILEQFGSVAAEVARLESCVGDRRARIAALDHREQKVGVGVALRGVEHIVHAFHRGGDAHRADMGRAFVGPDRQLHGQTSTSSRRTSGRAKSSARSAACSKP